MGVVVVMVEREVRDRLSGEWRGEVGRDDGSDSGEGGGVLVEMQRG